VGNILQSGVEMSRQPIRVVCPTCRTTIAESKYNYEKQQWNFETKEQCCDDSMYLLSQSVMNDLKESEVPSLKDEADKGELTEPSFYSWEINR
jgi:hypothetical protein